MNQNWMCPINGKVEVWDNPIAVLSHIYNTDGQGHGPKNSVIEDEELLMPQPTNSEKTMNTVGNYVKKKTETKFSGDIERLLSDLTEDGFEVPSQLDEKDLEHFKLMEMDRGVQNDLEILKSNIEYYDEIFTMMLQNFDSLVSQPQLEQTIEEEPEPEPEENDTTISSGGRFTTADVMEREEEQVFGVLNRSTLLDNHSDDLLKTFEYIYKERDTEGVYVDDVSGHLGIPDGLAEDNLETLNDKNLIRHDEDEDRYYIPY